MGLSPKQLTDARRGCDPRRRRSMSEGPLGPVAANPHCVTDGGIPIALCASVPLLWAILRQVELQCSVARSFSGGTWLSRITDHWCICIAQQGGRASVPISSPLIHLRVMPNRDDVIAANEVHRHKGDLDLFWNRPFVSKCKPCHSWWGKLIASRSHQRVQLGISGQ